MQRVSFYILKLHDFKNRPFYVQTVFNFKIWYSFQVFLDTKWDDWDLGSKNQTKLWKSNRPKGGGDSGWKSCRLTNHTSQSKLAWGVLFSFIRFILKRRVSHFVQCAHVLTFRQRIFFGFFYLKIFITNFENPLETIHSVIFSFSKTKCCIKKLRQIFFLFLLFIYFFKKQRTGPLLYGHFACDLLILIIYV